MLVMGAPVPHTGSSDLARWMTALTTLNGKRTTGSSACSLNPSRTPKIGMIWLTSQTMTLTTRMNSKDKWKRLRRNTLTQSMSTVPYRFAISGVRSEGGSCSLELSEVISGATIAPTKGDYIRFDYITPIASRLLTGTLIGCETLKPTINNAHQNT